MFAVERKTSVKEILPDNASPVVDKSRKDIVESVLDVEPEKEKPPAASRSRCLRSSAPGQVKRKPTKKRRIRTQNMTEEGTYWSDESAPESIEDGCLLLGLAQYIIDID